MERLAVDRSQKGEARFALALEHLYPDRRLRPETATQEAVSLVSALEGHTDARFVLQLHAAPDLKRRSSGRISIHLIASITESDSTDSAGRIEELSDDLLDILGAPPVRWAFRSVADDSELRAVLDPFEASHMAEIARREEPCSPVRWSSKAGFAEGAGSRSVDRSLWSTWTLGPPAAHMERLAAVLLAQEAPVCIRVVVSPTRLTHDERLALEELVMDLSGALPDMGIQRASLSTLEALLYLRPLFETRVLVASPDPLSRSLLSAIGATISQPSRHERSNPNHLEGGFAVVRGGHDVNADQLRAAYDQLDHCEPLPGLAPERLGRIRRVLGPWEAANAFRLPVTDDDFPGLESLATPDLEPPATGLPEKGQRIGRLESHGALPVLIDPTERFRHLYVSGQTGTGKSTLLFNLAMQDIEAGSGVAVLDPHGDLVEAILRNVPDERLDDVVLVDPADQVAVAGVNLLEAETPVQQHYIVSELCNLFYELFDPQRQGIVGPRFETMLRQAALLLLAHPDEPSSMLDISTLFIDPKLREYLVEGLEDPVLTEFWNGEMRQSRGSDYSEVVSWFRSKFEIFRTSRLVRSVIGQAESGFSFSDVLSEQKILLVNLSKGMLGEYNSSLIGHIVFTRLWSAALERASVTPEERPDFFVYIDEFQNMTSDSLPDVLSEARKFRVGVTLANQFFGQVPERTRDAIMGNVGNRVTFRVGPRDAEAFSLWMGSDIQADDMTTIPNHVGIASLSDHGVPLDPMVLRMDPPADNGDDDRAARARAMSRARYARPVDDLDHEFFARWRHVPGSISSTTAPATETTGIDESSFIDQWLAQRAPAED